MKTTIEINDNLLAGAKALASARRIPLRRVMEDALVLLLRQQGRAPNRGVKLRKHPFGGKGLHQDMADKDWNELREVIYAGRGGTEVHDDSD